MLNVPNAKVIVFGGSFKNGVRVALRAFRQEASVGVRAYIIDANVREFDAEFFLDIPIHMLTCKLDFLLAFKEMTRRRQEDDGNIVCELALEQCLQVIAFDISKPGEVICRIGLKVRGDVSRVDRYPLVDKHIYEKWFNFKKK